MAREANINQTHQIEQQVKIKMPRGGRRPGAGAKKGAPRRKPISGALARDFRPLSGKALQTLVNTLDDPTATAAAKVSAAIAVLDRGWGRPTERHEHVSLSAVAELSDDELRNAITLLRAAPGPLAEPAGGGKSTDDTAKLN